MITQKTQDKDIFDSYIHPIIENLLAPVFGYICAYALGNILFFVFTPATSVLIYNPSVATFAETIACFVLTITAFLTVCRFLNDDYAIALGKITQEPKIQALKSQIERLKQENEQLKFEASTNVILTDKQEFVNENLEDNPSLKIINDIELNIKQQKLFDSAMWMWDRATNQQKITKTEMTKLGMPQRQWNKAYQLLTNNQIITNDRELLIFDRQQVSDKIYEYLTG